jgi:hypothetical protein
LYIDTNGTTSATASPTAWRENINLISQTALCNSDLQLTLLQVEVINQTGKPLSGIVIVSSSLNGSERIITGLKPELGAGMVDFQMLSGIE